MAFKIWFWWGLKITTVVLSQLDDSEHPYWPQKSSFYCFSSENQKPLLNKEESNQE